MYRSAYNFCELPWLQDEKTQIVIKHLGAHNMRFVGGIVRDSLLGRPVSDIDISTTLVPDDVIKAFKKAGITVIPTGIKYGTVTVVIKKKHFEITTVRKDVETDGRHVKVEFSRDWKADAARRDFTMNALYMDAEGNVYDYFGGIPDARRGIVRFIGDPEARIKEDGLRILRYFRFLAYYGKEYIDQESLLACSRYKEVLLELSKERIAYEMSQLFLAPDPIPVLTHMLELGIIALFFGGAVDFHKLRMVIERENRLQDGDGLRRLWAFLHRSRSAGYLGDILRFSNVQKKRFLNMSIDIHALGNVITPENWQKAAYHYGIQTVIDKLYLQEGADAERFLFEHLGKIRAWQKPEFPITGKNLLDVGYEVGCRVGEELDRLEDIWCESGFSLSRDALLKAIKEPSAL